MINAPKKIERPNSMLDNDEVVLTLQYSFESNRGVISIYKVCFDPEYTYRTAFIYFLEKEGDIYRSGKYFRNIQEIESLFGEVGELA